MIPKIGQILRRVTPSQDLPQVIIAEAVEEAMVVAAVHQGGMWTVKMGNGASYHSHKTLEPTGLSRPLILPISLPDYWVEPLAFLEMQVPLDSWPPDGWELVE